MGADESGTGNIFKYQSIIGFGALRGEAGRRKGWQKGFNSQNVLP